MSNTAREDFAAMLAAAPTQSYTKGFNPGDKVMATIVSTKGDFIILDVHSKTGAIMPTVEVIDDDGDLTVNPGDQLEVTFVGMQKGSFLFTSKNKALSADDRALQDAFDNQIPVDGVVKAERTGGYEITIGSKQAFCPYSQIDLFKHEGEVYTDKKFTFLITEYSQDDRGLNIVVSRRTLLEKERAAQKVALLSELQEGETRKGTVTRIMEFGVFVDLGGMEGLVPLRELSWQRNVKPEDICKPGDTVEVMINSIDVAAERISLSIRNLEMNPWDEFAAKYTVGSTLTAKIVRIERFGAFAQLIPGVDGLLSNGRLAQGGKRISSAREVVSEGQELEVEIESIDVAKHQVALKPVDHRFDTLTLGELTVGHEVEGIVESIQSFGVFVRLSEEKTGLLHISETGIPKTGSPLQQLEHRYEPGTTVKLVVKSLEGGKIGLTTAAKWAEHQQAIADGDPMDWVRANNANNGSFGSLGDAFAGLNLN